MGKKNVKILLPLCAAFLLASCAAPQYSIEIKDKDMIKAAEDDTMIPVRQGGVNNRPYWNVYAKNFIHVPSFNFSKAKNAVTYRFTAEDRFKNKHIFNADTPEALLSPIWRTLPVGPVYLTVDALDKDGKKLRTVGNRVFYRNAPFNNGYPPAVCSYAESAAQAYEYLFNMKQIQELASGKPDLTFKLFCYPSKMYASIISGMINYAEMVPEKKAQAIAIARGAAGYLMEKAVPRGEVLEYLPQTYEGEQFAAKKFAGTIMMLYPANVGNAMIRLYQAVKDKKYLDYAVKIGDQYLRMQMKNGSWPLNVIISTGKAKEKNCCIPTGIMEFLDKLSAVTKDKKYAEASKKCLPYLRKMADSFDWEGQFEDVEAQSKAYLNLTFHNATSMYLYLCGKKSKVCKKLVAEAREIQRYSEDQFVVWEQPGWTGSHQTYRWRTKKDLTTRTWGMHRHYHYPATMEQYRCFVPIDSASGKMIRYYLMMYDLEKNPLDLAKARALGDSITRVQYKGRIPTWWQNTLDPELDWINCMYGTANALKLLATYDNIKL